MWASTSKVSKTIEKDKKIVLLPGRLTSWKGQEVFIEAVNLTNIELGYEAFYVVILGSDQGRELYKKKLIRLSEQYRMSKQIRFIDHCKNMALAYKVSDIIVSASNEPEAFGRVSVEAQAMGKFVIASNHGGSKETVIDNETGFLFIRPSDLIFTYVPRPSGSPLRQLYGCVSTCRCTARAFDSISWSIIFLAFRNEFHLEPQRGIFC